MKIQRVALTNIGPYIGENVFLFDIDNPEKNIVLIGGRNGAGKTTLFDTIKLCLYGYKLYGYRQNSQAYLSKIKKLINDGAKRTAEAHAEASLTIFIDDGYNRNFFTITRSWELYGNQVKEAYAVQKDNVPLGPEEQADFDNYLLQTIPPALFDLHFFNGENIAETLFDQENGESFRKAFMQLCGLDTLDLIEEQLHTNARLRMKNEEAPIQEELDEKRALKDQWTAKAEELNATLRQKKGAITALEEESTRLDADMARYGGVQAQEWDRLQSGIKAEEDVRNEKRKYLKESANHILPFLILEKELSMLQEQIRLETAIASNKAIYQRLFSKEFAQTFARKIAPAAMPPAAQPGEDFLQVLYDAIKYDVPEDAKELLKLSESEQLRILAKIESCSSFDKKEIIQAEADIKTSHARTKELRTQLESKELLNSESYLKRKNDLLMRIDSLRKEELALSAQVQETGAELEGAAQEYEKAKAAWKAMMKEKSVHDLTARTLLAFSELKQRLYQKYTSFVETVFMQKFSRLIDKDDLLDGIYIDSRFEVVPYKNQTVELSALREMEKEHGADFLKERLGERALLAFQEQEGAAGARELPVKIEKHFSAGEHQIFVMALYQTLSELRTSEIPFVIDTPLARIDSRHRKNIIENFFSKLSGQVIILSTDEEIDAGYAAALKDKLSDIYLIEHQAKGVSHIYHKQYFEEASV